MEQQPTKLTWVVRVTGWKPGSDAPLKKSFKNKLLPRTLCTYRTGTNTTCCTQSPTRDRDRERGEPTRLTKTWVVRVFGPAIANDSVPRMFDSDDGVSVGSSSICDGAQVRNIVQTSNKVCVVVVVGGGGGGGRACVLGGLGGKEFAPTVPNPTLKTKTNLLPRCATGRRECLRSQTAPRNPGPRERTRCACSPNTAPGGGNGGRGGSARGGLRRVDGRRFEVAEGGNGSCTYLLLK